MEGHPVQILHVTETGIKLDVQAVERILHDKHVRDKMVCVLSVAGAFRKGKSFILNFMLRYLQNKGSRDWMGDPNKPLRGFDWRGGRKRNTTGILMWSKAFVAKTAYGEEVAIILMDTQGTFDCESTMKECATVFALSSMISSVQVYNLSQQIQENDLQNLQMFTEYGRLAYEKDECDAPFQKLLFLVRDWQCADEVEYGIHGGENYLKEILETSGSQKPELKEVRQHIRKYIKEVACFLMPHPGSAVASSKFDGRLSGVEAEFKEQLSPLMHATLSPGKLITKEIYGKKITAGQLFEYFKSYTNLLKSEKLPNPMTIYESTAHANNQIAISEAKNQYMINMDQICSDHKSFSPDQLRAEHSRQKQYAVDLFRKTKKMGRKEFCAHYEQSLITQLDHIFESYREANELKLKNEQQELKHMKERAEFEDKMMDMTKRMKKGEIEHRKHKEEIDGLKKEIQKCKREKKETIAMLERNMYDKREQERLIQLVEQQRIEQNDLARQMELTRAREHRSIGGLIKDAMGGGVIGTVIGGIFDLFPGVKYL